MLEHVEICLAGEVLDLVRPLFELSVHKDGHGTVCWREIHGSGRLGVFELTRTSHLFGWHSTRSVPGDS